MKGLIYSLSRIFRKNKEVFFIAGGLGLLGAFLLSRRKDGSSEGRTRHFSSKGGAEIVDTVHGGANMEGENKGRKRSEAKSAPSARSRKEDKKRQGSSASEKIREGSMDNRIENFIDGEHVGAESTAMESSKDSKGSNVKLGQCKAITKKGTRCRNKAIDLSGYCLRHKQVVVAE